MSSLIHVLMTLVTHLVPRPSAHAGLFPYLRPPRCCDRKDGGESGGPIGQGGWIYAAVSHAGRVWAEAHGCPGRDVIYPTPWDDYVTCYKHGSCADSVEVVRCLWDGEHTWPSLPTKADASRMVWWFLKNHPFTGPIPARMAAPTHYFNATVPRRVAPTKPVAAMPGLRIDV